MAFTQEVELRDVSAETIGVLGRMLDHVYSRLTDEDAFLVITVLREALDGAELTITTGTPPADEDGLAR